MNGRESSSLNYLDDTKGRCAAALDRRARQPGIVQPARATLILEMIAAVVTLAVFLFVRFVHLHTHAKCRAGVWVMLLNALFITLFEIFNVGMAANAVGRPSWMAILILTSAMIMPSTPRRTLIAGHVFANVHLGRRRNVAVGNVPEDGTAVEAGARAWEL